VQFWLEHLAVPEAFGELRPDHRRPVDAAGSFCRRSTMNMRRAIFLSTGERYVGMLINFVSIAVVSRTLTYDQVGLVAIGMALTHLIETLRDSGQAGFVIQAGKADRDKPRTAFAIMAAMTVVMVVPLLVFAGPIAKLYGDARVGPLLTVLALAYIPGPFIAVPFAIMRRDFNFGPLAKIGISGALAAGLVTVVLCMQGFGELSYAYALLASNLVLATLTLWTRRDLWWAIRPSLARLKEALEFGGYGIVCGFLSALGEFLPNVYLVRVLNLQALGLYNRALLLTTLPDKILLTGFSAVALPTFSAVARDGQNMKAAYLRGLEYLSAVKLPVHCLLALLAGPAVRVLFGSKWDSVVPLVQILSLATLAGFPYILGGAVLVAAGEVRLVMRAMLIGWPISTVTMYIAAQFGLKALALSWVVSGVAMTLPTMLYVKRLTGFSWAEAYAAVHKSLLATAIGMILPLAIFCITDRVSVPLAFVVCAIGMFGWLHGLRVTRHPLLQEIHDAIGTALAVPVVARWLRRIPQPIRTAVATSVAYTTTR
jgi:O-antigen/teichoic acid export membrane protein